jgi:hypothetical protein
MKHLRVIPGENLPTRLPVHVTVLYGLLLDRFDAVGWVWGAVGTAFVFVWAIAIYGICHEESTKLAELEQPISPGDGT